MYNYKEFPEVDEYVVVTISNINPNSAFAKLDEYHKKSGMIHISEVASTWIKDIRKHLSVGDKKVAKVISVDIEKGYINLSLKRVKPNTEREKKTEFKNEKRAQQLLAMVAKELGVDAKDVFKEVGYKLQETYGLLYTAFEVACDEGSDALVADGIDKKWALKIEEVAKNSIRPKEVTIRSIIEAKSFKSDGVEIIRKGFSLVDDPHVHVAYINAPKYSFNVTAPDFKGAEKILKDSSQKVLDYINKNGGEATLSREK